MNVITPASKHAKAGLDPESGTVLDYEH